MFGFFFFFFERMCLVSCRVGLPLCDHGSCLLLAGDNLIALIKVMEWTK